MVASEFLSYINVFSVTQYSGLEDFADKANFQGNIIALMLCVLIVSMRQYFMNPIICFLSTAPGGSNIEDYITNMCWVEGTVPMNFSAKVSHKAEDWKKLEEDKLNYYQWIPFVLGLQAVLYYIPRLIWQFITYNRVGVDLEQLLKDANDANSKDEETKEKIVEHVSKNIEMMLFGHRKINPPKNNFFNRIVRHLPGKRRGNLLVSLYLLIKLMYILIGYLQLHFMYYFLRLDRKEGYILFGYRILENILIGRQWSDTQVFPRIVMCRSDIEQMGTINYPVAQCLLPINMLNEKIYIFLYFLLSLVCILTILSFPLWIYRIFYRKTHKHLVKRYLKMNEFFEQSDQETKHLVDRFVVEFLRQDGNFIIRMLSMNAGDLITSFIVCRLLEIYSKEGYMVIDLRNRKNYTVDRNSKEFMSIPLENKGYAIKSSNKPSAPHEKMIFL